MAYTPFQFSRVLYAAFLMTGLLAVLIPSVAAQTGVITGNLVARRTGEPVSDASVSLTGNSLETLPLTKSSADGSFLFSALAAGNYTLTVEDALYQTQSQRLTVLENDTVRVRLALRLNPFTAPETVVEAQQDYSASSSEAVRAIDFELRPRQSAQDLLRVAPGLFIAQHAGGGKAEQIFIRGFDCDHGTDIALSIDGTPINMVSHGHGQGYADAHFIIPETVSLLDVQKGTYDASKGDFATGGAVSFRTLDFLEQNALTVEGGGYGTARVLGMFQLPIDNPSLSGYVATEYFHNDSFFESPQNFNRYNVFGKVRAALAGQSALTFSVGGFSSGWNASGQIPQRAVDAGLITRFGGIDVTEGGTTQRQSFNLTFTSPFKNDASLLAQAYFIRYRFRLYSNFTFFAADSVNGDGIEQGDARNILGFNGAYSWRQKLGSIKSTTSVGTQFRSDNIDTDLWRQRQRTRLDPTSLTTVQEQSVSIYAKEELVFSPVLRAEFGLRGDYFTFDVEDRLRASGDFSGTFQKPIVNPKASVVVTPVPQVQLYLNAGGGFHSNDARGVVSRQSRTALAQAIGAEVGVRVQPVPQVIFTATAWNLDLESELVYVGDEGTTEENGRTRRSGLDFDARAQLLPWLFFDVDVNIARSRLRELPNGENFIPLSPTFTSVGGLTARHPSGVEGSLRYRYLAERPANEDNSIRAQGYTVCDAAIGYRFGNYRVGVSVENIFDVQWNEAQFATESRLQGEPEAVDELHFTPGTPVNARASVSVFF